MTDAPGGRLQCLSYTPYDGSSTPLDPATYKVAPGRIHADLEALHPFTNCIRTYSSLPPQDDVVREADKLGMQVYLGIWVNADAKDTQKEIATALALAKAYPKAIRALVVGNEVMLRREMTGEQLAAIIRDVKARSGLQVTYADIFEFWRRNPVLAQAVDFMAIHILPHWDDPAPVSIDEVQAHVRGIIARVQRTFPGKPMIIGEIGWPSAGRTRGAAVPSLVNEARFIREFVNGAEAIGVPYNIIEAIDQKWKRYPEGTVGGYWGLLNGDRMLKFPLTGPVREWPHWELAFAASLILTAIVLAWGMMPGRRLGLLRWLALGVLRTGARVHAGIAGRADGDDQPQSAGICPRPRACPAHCRRLRADLPAAHRRSRQTPDRSGAGGAARSAGMAAASVPRQPDPGYCARSRRLAGPCRWRARGDAHGGGWPAPRFSHSGILATRGDDAVSLAGVAAAEPVAGRSARRGLARTRARRNRAVCLGRSA